MDLEDVECECVKRTLVAISSAVFENAGMNYWIPQMAG
jgi:hypothetical protein